MEDVIAGFITVGTCNLKAERMLDSDVDYLMVFPDPVADIVLQNFHVKYSVPTFINGEDVGNYTLVSIKDGQYLFAKGNVARLFE